MQHFSNQWPLKAHIGDSQLVESSWGEASCSDTEEEEEPGIELATFLLPANPLYLLSDMPPMSVNL